MDSPEPEETLDKPSSILEPMGVLESKIDSKLPMIEKEITQSNGRSSPENEKPLKKFPFVERFEIMREIDLTCTQVEKALEVLQTQLIDYRLFLIGLDFILDEVDHKVWTSHDQIHANLRNLKRNSFKIPLIIRSLNTLKSLQKAWKQLQSEENNLISLLTKAPQELEFYDKIQTMRIQKHEEQIRRMETERQVETAHRSLEDTLIETDRIYSTNNQILLGSNILQYEDIRRLWESRVAKIEQVKKDESIPFENLLTQIFTLKNDIHNATNMISKIKEIEKDFSGLISMHDVLTTMGKKVIPESEVARTMVMLYEQIPQLWASGSYDELKRRLLGIEKFLDFYRETIQLEMETIDRHRPGPSSTFLSTKEESGEMVVVINTLKSLVNAIDSRDRFMRGHSEKVAKISVQTARNMNWSKTNLELLEMAALLHDVGKLSIPESILIKNGPLTSDERNIIERHPYYGANIIRPIPYLSDIVPWIYHHQERWDGKGYPDHLFKQEIPLASDIISVAEAYSVMTIDFPYRNALKREEAIAHIEDEAGAQFNPEVIEAFTDSITH